MSATQPPSHHFQGHDPNHVSGHAHLTDTSAATRPVSVRELKGLMADWRRGRATKSFFEALQDGYVVVLSVVVLGAMLINVLLGAQSGASGCDSAGCASARTLLPWSVLAASVALSAAAARLFGPVVASAPEGFWLMDSPINRAGLLRGRLVLPVVIALVGGAVFGALVTLLTGSPAPSIIAFAAATGVASAATVGVAAAEQGAGRSWLTRAVVWLFSAVAVAGLFAVTAIVAGWIQWDVGLEREAEIAISVGVVAAIIGLLATLLANARLNRIQRNRLTSGGALVAGMSGAMFAMDLGLARDIVVERACKEKGFVRPTRGKGTGVDALVRREGQRLLRKPSVLLPVLGSIVVPYALNSLGLSKLSPMLSALVLFGAMIPLLGGLRVLTRSVGLQRCFPFSEPQIRQASITIAAAVALVWSIAISPSMMGFGADRTAVEGIPVAVLTAAAGLLGAVRWTSARPVNYSAPMMASPMGTMPPGMIVNLLKGFEVALLITAPLVFGWSWIISVVIAGIAFWLVMGNVNMEQMQEQQAEQKKQLEEARKAKAKGKGRR